MGFPTKKEVRVIKKKTLPIPKIKSCSREDIDKIQFGHLHPKGAVFLADISFGSGGTYLNRVTFVRKDKKVKMVQPAVPDKNYPVRGFFNAKKRTTVLLFSNGTNVKVVSDSESRNKAHVGIVVALAKRILGPASGLNNIYQKFRSEAQAEAVFYGVALSYFVANGIVKDQSDFDLWLAQTVAGLNLHNKKEK